MLRESIGDQLYQERIRQELTQEELADRCGISDRHVRNIEKAKSNFKIDMLEKICNGLYIAIYFENDKKIVKVLEYV